MAVYTVGQWTVTAQTPVLVHTSAGAADPSWFSGLLDFHGRAVLCHYSNSADVENLEANHRHVLSLDRGATWESGTNFRVRGHHLSNEPLAMTMPSMSRTTARHPPASKNRVPHPGLVKGGSHMMPVQAGLRSLKCDYVEITNGGLGYYQARNGVTVSGFTADLAGTYGYWHGEIVQVSATQWLSVLQVSYDGVVLPFQAECIESTDQGRTWTVVGTVASKAAAVGAEGYSEPTMIRLPSGKLVVISRTGLKDSSWKCYRVTSTDNGRTWSSATADRVNVWAKSPKLLQLTNGDFALTCGYENVPDVGHHGLALWLETSADSGTWANYLDLIDHHNATVVDGAQHFNTALPHSGCSGYTGMIEIDANRLLISYDRSPGAYGVDGTPNRVYVVDVTIART
jgi:BNR repeat protein